MATQITPEMGRRGKEKSKGKSKEKILQIMTKNPQVTTQEIADTLKLSIAGIEKSIRLLKKQNRLQRMGPDKGGHWKVAEA